MQLAKVPGTVPPELDADAWARHTSASLSDIECDHGDERGDEQEDRVHCSLLGSRSGDSYHFICSYRRGMAVLAQQSG
jgi:hypothetical protein